MTSPLDLSRLTITGPFWTAELVVSSLDTPERNLALRRLFLDQTRRRIGGVDQVLAPGTLIALGVVQRVVVTPGAGAQPATYEWRRAPNAPLPALETFAEVRQAIESSAAALLLLAADPAQWPPQAAGRAPTLTLVAGDIGLDALVPQQNAIGRLEQALGLSSPPAASVRAPGRISVHAGGLSILGQVALPWLGQSNNRVTALCQLTRALPTPAPGGAAFLLTIERERLLPEERDALIDAAQRLSLALNPTYALNNPARPDAVVPELVTLELTNPTVPPRISWSIAAWGGVGNLSFGAGEVSLLIGDRQPYRADRLPTALARVFPDSVTITPTADGMLTVVVTGGSAPALPGPATAPPDDSLHYTYVAGSPPAESLRLTGITVAYNPIEAAESLRVAQDLPVPEWNNRGDTPLAEPLIWGFVALEDGWAQLPFLNVSEQIYLDAGVAWLDEEALGGAAPGGVSIQGAASFGNRRFDGSIGDRCEHPWSLTVTAAAGVAGVWTLAPAGPDAYQVARIDLTAARPDLLIDGLLWLSNGRPTVESALPELDDWITGLGAIRLRRVRTRRVDGQEVTTDLFPALLNFKLETLDLVVPAPATDPQLGGWALEYQLDNPQIAIPTGAGGASRVIGLIERLFIGAADRELPALLPANLLSRYEALAWRRHPALPTIQALPLIQTKNPPNAPIAGRQLAPFALPTQPGPAPIIAAPAGWRFGVLAAAGDPAIGALTWPALLGATAPSGEWRLLPDLPMAALSLPGLVLSPSPYTAGSGLPPDWLPLQYRYDLPYADEVQALARLPRVVQRRGEVSPLPDDPPPATPRPLLRADYAAHWDGLSEQASLAAADAVDAFDHEADATVIRHLIEPYRWPVEPALDLDAYPGSLTIRDPGAADAPIVLRGGEAAADSSGATVADLSDAALMGISGRFRADPANGLIGLTPGDPQAISVQAGSMAAYRTAQGAIRDQRGLSRAPTRATAQLLATDVWLEESDAGAEAVSLTSLREPLDLSVAPGHAWRLWFRDLPVRAGSFEREMSRSPLNQDSNDPEATARAFNHLSGYEWRIADAAYPGGSTQVLRLAGLEFYPLTIEAVTVSADRVSEVVICGRLQLPLAAQPAELTDLSNAVRARFVAASGALTLAEVSVAPSPQPDPLPGEWPLALADGELTEAPRIVWGGVRYDAAAHALTLIDAHLRFSLFTVSWDLPLPADAARFTAELTALAITPILAASDAAIAPVGCALQLALRGDTAGAHTLALDLAIRLRSQAHAASGQPPIVQRAFHATLRFPLLGQASGRPVLLAARLFEDIVLADAQDQSLVQLVLVEQTCQFSWGGWRSAPDGLALLAGMPIAGAGAPGCAVVSFRAVRQQHAPLLLPTLAFIETALDARWGTFLQAEGAPVADEATVFGPSAGVLSFGYTAHLRADPAPTPRTETELSWDERTLLNGFLEVKSLISWPAGLRFDEGTGMLTVLGLTRSAPDLSHVRHTLRVLLNQHEPPADTLRFAPGPHALFELNPNRPWQLLAVVEHQLIDVALTPTPGGAAQPALGIDRRWTVSQEVRLLAPQSFRDFLQAIGAPELRTIDPIGGLAPLTDSGEGYFDPAVRAALADAVDRQAAQGPWTIVEASAPHWVRRATLSDSRPTALQYLPVGSQHAILSGPDDYAPAAPDDRDGAWLLLTTPFLGRIMPDPVPTAPLPDGALAVDPVLQLQRALGAGAAIDPLLLMLTNRGLGTADILMSHLETAAGRRWARLDPLGLDENWFRLHTLPPEEAPPLLAGVAAALPDTPARAGRSTALRRAFDVFRPFIPPASPPDGLLPGGVRYQVPPEISGAELVWRERSLLAPASVGRAGTRFAPAVTRGLQLLYTFGEGRGATIGDSAGVGAPYPLQIADPTTVRWLPGGGLRILRPARISGVAPASRLIAACRESNAITIEVWIVPQTATVGDASRIVTLSANRSNRNVTVQQGSTGTPAQLKRAYNVRVRTSTTNNEGAPALETPPGTTPVQLTQLVFTRAASGERRLYLDGRLVAQDTVAGTFANWDTTVALLLADEQGGDRPWLGTYRMLAIYNEALTEAEVAANFAAYPGDLPGGWRTAAALLTSGGIITSTGEGEGARDYFVAATLLPARLSVTQGEPAAPTTLANPQPLGFAISPYLGFAFYSRPAHSSLEMIVAELVCVDLVSGRLSPVATRLFVIEEAPDPDQAIVAWAREQHRLLAPESRAALVRLREIRRRDQLASDAGRSAVLVTDYRFLLVENLSLQGRLHVSTARLRAPAGRLRFREGQYGGNLLPEVAALFELAPPQTTGVQPVVLSERPASTPGVAPPEGQAADGVRWPWGLSGMRYSVRYTDRQRGASSAQGGNGPDTAATLWWQSFQYHVQFRSALHEAPLFTLPLSQESLFQAEAAGAAMIAAFAAYQIPLGAGSVITPVAPGAWAIDDRENRVSYRARKREFDLVVTRKSPPAAGLPPLFRAPPMRSLLPVVPDAPLPPVVAVLPQPAEGAGEPRRRLWQPVLPGGLRYLLTGVRAGVMLATRAGVTSQRTDGSPAYASGSIPVQHRTPRPVVLPPNRLGHEAVALRTWASFFEPERNVLVTARPVDEAFYGAADGLPAHRLRLRLLQLEAGVVPPDWDGRMLLEVITTVPLLSSDLNVTLTVGSRVFPLAIDLSSPLLTVAEVIDADLSLRLGALRAALATIDAEVAPDAQPESQGPGVWLIRTTSGAQLRVARIDETSSGAVTEVRAAPTQVGVYLLCRPAVAAQREAIQRQIGTVGGGAAIQLQVEVVREADVEEVTPWPFRQLLSFGLRVAAPEAPPLPLRPQFLHFEDPEYNRALATQAGRAERMLKLPVQGQNQFGLFTLTLATDRRSYNSDSPLALIFSMDQADAALPAFDVRFERVTTGGVADPLRIAADGRLYDRLPLSNKRLLQLRLGDLRLPTAPSRPALEPDQKLRVRLFANGQSWKTYRLPNSTEELIRYEVDIVADPVIPVPAAAYALLRHQLLNGRPQVECVRFAWGPDASRIDLVAKDDLLLGVVRRRAVFRWRDVARVGTAACYAIQKITATGSTHIPTAWEHHGERLE